MLFRKRKARKVLVKAREILVEEGWTTGRMGTPGYPSCLLGAIRQAGDGKTHGVFETTVVGQTIDKLLTREIGETSVTYWNDRQNSVEPVLELLDKVIAK